MKIRTLSQILAEGSESMFDFDDLIIEKNFLTKGKTWVISGASGIGKSVLAMQLALGLALGEKTLGLDVFKPAKTLLLHNENPILDERDYFRGIVSHFALDKKPNFGGLNENLRFVCKTGCYYSVDEFISKLDAALSAGKYDVAIVDSLSSFVHCNFSDHAAVADLRSAQRNRCGIARLFRIRGNGEAQRVRSVNGDNCSIVTFYFFNSDQIVRRAKIPLEENVFCIQEESGEERKKCQCFFHER